MLLYDTAAVETGVPVITMRAMVVDEANEFACHRYYYRAVSYL